MLEDGGRMSDLMGQAAGECEDRSVMLDEYLAPVIKSWLKRARR
jgi:hypothetical protein